jgi:Gly-Xaa carboxypeptidase
VLHERYGDDGLAVVVDEGAGFEEAWGTLFAKPGSAEKGSINVYVTVRSPGGHSSIPHDHTSIGILSELVYLLESTQYPTRLYEENPYFTQLQCGAAYSPKFDTKLKKLLDKRLQTRNTCTIKHDLLALEAAKQGPEIKYLLQTSQAVDVISGGVKVNALPERAQAVVNYRVNGMCGYFPEFSCSIHKMSKSSNEMLTICSGGDRTSRLGPLDPSGCARRLNARTEAACI